MKKALNHLSFIIIFLSILHSGTTFCMLKLLQKNLISTNPTLRYFATKEKNLIVLMGPPGCGKSTLSKHYEKFGWQNLSVGQLFRQHATNQTEIGKKIIPFVKSGQLVPDNLVIKVVETSLKHHIQKYGHLILDGFPRTITQIEWLNLMLKNTPNAPNLILVRMLETDGTIINQVANRYVCPKCDKSYLIDPNSLLLPKKHMTCDRCCSALTKRDDDTQVSIKMRLQQYRLYEKALLDFYGKDDSQKVLAFSLKFVGNTSLEKQCDDFKKLIEI